MVEMNPTPIEIFIVKEIKEDIWVGIEVGNQTLKVFFLIFLTAFSEINSKDIWYEKNLKDLEDISLELNVVGIKDDVWESRLYNFLELRILEHDIVILKNQIPKLVIDINIIDSRVEKTSFFFVGLSLYSYSISEKMYYNLEKPGRVLFDKQLKLSLSTVELTKG